jgi:branched-chain amino acid transport system substrate-binding protein
MDKIKKIILGISLVAIALTLAACSLKPAKLTDKEPIKIGYIGALTGKSAYIGTYIKNGLDLAVEEINQKGINGREIKIIYEDSKSETNEAVKAVNKLIEIDQVPIIVGFDSSSSVLAAAPIAEQQKVILFAPVASAVEITNAGDYVFRNRESSFLHGEKMAELAFNKLNFKSVAILAVNSENGLGYQAGFVKKFEELGGTISKIDNYVKGEKDFRTSLTKINGTNPQAIYLAGYAAEMAEIIKQAKELDINAQLLASAGIETKDLFTIIKPPLGDGLIYSYPAFNPNDSAIADYQKKFEAKYGNKSEAFAANSYDAMKIITQALKVCGTKTSCIKDEIYKIKDYPGVGGLTTFNENGDVVKPIIFKTIKNGEFIIYQ